MINTSRSPHAVSAMNCLIDPDFWGPLQMIGVSWESIKNPIDMTLIPLLLITGIISPCSIITSLPSTPNILGMFGPWMSASSIPVNNPFFWKASAKLAATVDLPTPPFPLMTAILYLIFFICSKSLNSCSIICFCCSGVKFAAPWCPCPLFAILCLISFFKQYNISYLNYLNIIFLIKLLFNMARCRYMQTL